MFTSAYRMSLPHIRAMLSLHPSILSRDILQLIRWCSLSCQFSYNKIYNIILLGSMQDVEAMESDDPNEPHSPIISQYAAHLHRQTYVNMDKHPDANANETIHTPIVHLSAGPNTVSAKIWRTLSWLLISSIPLTRWRSIIIAFT